MARRAAPRIVVETEGSYLSSTDVADVELRARPGDRIVIRPHRLGEHPHDGEIVDVLGEDGGPPYLVRWSDDGHVSRLFPGSDAFVEHFAPHPGKRGRRGSRGRRTKEVKP